MGIAPDRRTFLKTAVSAAAYTVPLFGAYTKLAESNAATSLFEGRTLDGWMQIENSWTSFGSSDLVDLAGLAKKVADNSDPVSAFLSGRMDQATKSELAAYGAASPAAADTKSVSSALAKALTQIIQGTSLYASGAFRNVQLRPEVQRLLQQNPHGADLVRLNRMLLEDAFPAELAKIPAAGWIVKDGAMASTGTGRGVIYTARDFGRFRLTFTMRHVSGNPDHQACVLIFCTRPQGDDLPLDALGGIQFQVPKGGHWDYRPGQNNAGNEEFMNLRKPSFDPHEWSRVEILADASTGIARMAVAQPFGTKAMEILDFKNAEAGKTGPIALQIHNSGLFDEYKDIMVEENPEVFDLITVS